QSVALGEVRRVSLRLGNGDQRELTLVYRRQAGTGWVVGFEQIGTRTAAEGLLGSRVSVFRDDLQPPGEGEFFQGDLIGLTAVNEAGKILGTVAQILITRPLPHLVVPQQNSRPL